MGVFLIGVARFGTFGGFLLFIAPAVGSDMAKFAAVSAQQLAEMCYDPSPVACILGALRRIFGYYFPYAYALTPYDMIRSGI